MKRTQKRGYAVFTDVFSLFFHMRTDCFAHIRATKCNLKSSQCEIHMKGGRRCPSPVMKNRGSGGSLALPAGSIENPRVLRELFVNIIRKLSGNSSHGIVITPTAPWSAPVHVTPKCAVPRLRAYQPHPRNTCQQERVQGLRFPPGRHGHRPARPDHCHRFSSDLRVSQLPGRRSFLAPAEVSRVSGSTQRTLAGIHFDYGVPLLFVQSLSPGPSTTLSPPPPISMQGQVVHHSRGPCPPHHGHSHSPHPRIGPVGKSRRPRWMPHLARKAGWLARQTAAWSGRPDASLPPQTGIPRSRTRGQFDQ